MAYARLTATGHPAIVQKPTLLDRLLHRCVPIHAGPVTVRLDLARLLRDDSGAQLVVEFFCQAGETTVDLQLLAARVGPSLIRDGEGLRVHSEDHLFMALQRLAFERRWFTVAQWRTQLPALRIDDIAENFDGLRLVSLRVVDDG